MRSTICIALFLSFTYQVFSQNDTLPAAKNFIYTEAGGAGGYGSLNYERLVLRSTKLMLTVRLGVGSYRLKDYANSFNPDIIIPLTAYASYGNMHKIELGLGETLGSIVHANMEDHKPTRRTNLNTHLSLGYRFHKKSGGLLFRFAYTPLFEFNNSFRHWFSAAVGYGFKGRK
jgi:hypothetical protein